MWPYWAAGARVEKSRGERKASSGEGERGRRRHAARTTGGWGRAGEEGEVTDRCGEEGKEW